jgi:hypothetical protein
MLAPHPNAALEYTFFKVNAPPIALLVDWIDRRKANERVLRVSIHAPDKREVLFDTLTDSASFLNSQRTEGRIKEIEWALDIGLGQERLIPQIFPSAQLRMFDMTLISAPLATFSGWIRCGETRIELQRTPGLVAQYWGRRLMREWWWISAHQFDRPDVTVEAMALRSGLWGLPLAIPLGYLYLKVGDQRRMWIAPPALVRSQGMPESFEIEFRQVGSAPIRLKGQGRDYGDLGDNIVNTLVGDLEIWQGDQLLATAAGTAGLERRRLSR